MARRALGEAVLRDAQDQLFRLLHRQHAVGGQLERRRLARRLVLRAGAAAGEVGLAFGAGRLEVAQDRDRDDLVLPSERDAGDADGVAALHDPQVGHVEAAAQAVAGGQGDVVLWRDKQNRDELALGLAVLVLQFDRDLAALVHAGEVGGVVPADGAEVGDEDQRQLLDRRAVVRKRHDRLNGLLGLELEEVHEGPSTDVRGRLGQLVGDLRMREAAVGEEQQGRLRGADDGGGDRILDGLVRRLLTAHVGREVRALDVAARRHGDDDVLELDEILVAQGVEGRVLDGGAPPVRERGLDLLQLAADDPVEDRLHVQDLQVAADLDRELAGALGDLVPLQARQPREAHLEDRAHLRVREAERVADGDVRVDLGEELGEPAGGVEVEGEKGRAGLIDVVGGADQRDDLVDAQSGGVEADLPVQVLPGLLQAVHRAAADDLAPEVDELAQDLQDAHGPRTAAAVEAGHVDVEVRDEVGLLAQPVEDHGRIGVLAHVDHDPDAGLVGRLVADVRDALDLLLLDELGELLHELGLDDEVGELGDHDPAPARLAFLD